MVCLYPSIQQTQPRDPLSFTLERHQPGALEHRALGGPALIHAEDVAVGLGHLELEVALVLARLRGQRTLSAMPWVMRALCMVM